eukprot:53447-Prymnesium_polylepis.1
MAMKVTELKEELEARDEAKSGNKAWLRRRLHAAIVREASGSREEGFEHLKRGGRGQGGGLMRCA